MIWRLMLEQMEGSAGIVFPPELVDQLGLRDGDELGVTETEDGILLTLSKGETRSRPTTALP
jgi:antitoxin component of MazEF toxin-antitoxin module